MLIALGFLMGCCLWKAPQAFLLVRIQEDLISAQHKFTATG